MRKKGIGLTGLVEILLIVIGVILLLVIIGKVVLPKFAPLFD